MGTNYEWTSLKGEVIHIGKSSAGWCFSLHVYPDDLDGPQNLEGWTRLFGKLFSKIRNEYGEIVTKRDMIETITSRSRLHRALTRGTGFSSEAEFLEKNHAIWGPNNLLRSKIDGTHTIGHGAGTWDLHIGNFS